MPLSRAEIGAYQKANQHARTLIRTRLAAYVKGSWEGLGSWRDADVNRWVAATAPRVAESQKLVANLTATYLGKRLSSTAVDTIDTSALRGVDPTEVYRRPAKTLYRELSLGKSFGAALSASTARALDIAATDVQLAMTSQASASMQAGGVQFYQRVLVGPEDCALCMIASTQHYRTGDLMPIHPGCNCDVEPLDSSTGRFEAMDGSYRVIDPVRLENTHNMVKNLVGSTDRGGRSPDYRKLISVREHGEIGPTLTFRHQGFTGPEDL
ncbi:MAG: hypothetical protein ACKOAF_05425 [Actinomycetes bacterium]